MNCLALSLLTAVSALPTTFSSAVPREWYNGSVGRLPDYRLVKLQPVNAVGTTLLFACSAATRDTVRFRWHIQHPTGVNVSRSTRARSAEVELSGRVFYVRDSLLRITSPSPHNGTVQCTVVGSFDVAHDAPTMGANYSVLATVNIESCLTLGDDYCPRDRASCSVDHAQGLSCRCFDAFPRRDPFHGVCFAPVKLGKRCLFDHECEPEHSWCLHQACACRPLYRPVAEACKPVARLGEPCQKDQCAAPYTVCKNGRCGCRDHSDDVDGVCAPASYGAFGGALGANGPQQVKAFGPMRTDAATLLLLAGFGVVLAIVTLCYTLRDFRHRVPDGTTAVSAEGLLPRAHGLSAPTS